MASQHIVGVHVAMFTDAEVLSSAAFIEFRRQVDALLARGGRAGALRLWSSVVLFEHMPPSPRGTSQQVFPLRGSPFAPRMSVHAAIRGEGASFSRGSGFGTGVGPSCPLRSLLRKPGIGMLVWAPRWTSSLQPYRTPYSADNFAPSYLWEFMQKVPGDSDLLPLQTSQSEVLCYMRHWILGSPHGLWSNPFRAQLPDISHLPRHLDALHPKIRAHRALHGWLGSSINGETEFPPACCGCGDPTYRQRLGCIKGVCTACFPALQICPVCRELSSSDDDSG